MVWIYRDDRGQVPVRIKWIGLFPYLFLLIALIDGRMLPEVVTLAGLHESGLCQGVGKRLQK